MKTWQVLFCGRYRPISVLVIVFALWGLMAAVFIVREDKGLSRFQRLRIGMTKTELVRTVGEPQSKQHVEWSQIPSEIRTDNANLTEYFYEVGRSWSSSYLLISGIFLDESEKTLEFVELKTSIIDVSGKFKITLLLIVIYGSLAVLIWVALVRLCKKTKSLT